MTMAGISQTLADVDQAQRLALYDSIVEERDGYRRRVQQMEGMLQTLVFACLPQEFDEVQRAQPGVVQEWGGDEYFQFLSARLPALLHDLRALAASESGQHAQELRERLQDREDRLGKQTQSLVDVRDKLQVSETRRQQLQGEKSKLEADMGRAKAEIQGMRQQLAYWETKFADYRRMVQSTVAAIRMAQGASPDESDVTPAPTQSLVLNDSLRRVLTVMGKLGLCRQRSIFQELVAGGLSSDGLDSLPQQLEVMGLVTSTTVKMEQWRRETVWQLTPAGRQAYLADDSADEVRVSEVELMLPVCPSMLEAVFRLDVADLLEEHGAVHVERRPKAWEEQNSSYTPHLVAEIPGPGRVPILCILQLPGEERVLDMELDRYAIVCPHYYAVCPDNKVMRAAFLQLYEHRKKPSGARRRIWMTNLVGLEKMSRDKIWKYENK